MTLVVRILIRAMIQLLEPEPYSVHQPRRSIFWMYMFCHQGSSMVRNCSAVAVSR
jgi:hypothetical protein